MIRWTLAAILALCAFWISTSTVQSFRTGKPVHLYRSPVTRSSVMAVADRWQLRLWHWNYQQNPPTGQTRQGSLGGFAFEFSSRKAGNGLTLVTHKLAMPSVVAMIPAFAFPIVVVVRWPFRRFRRWRQGLCLKCGYDLTGVAGERCPECGIKLKTRQVAPVEATIDR